MYCDSDCPKKRAKTRPRNLLFTENQAIFSWFWLDFGLKTLDSDRFRCGFLSVLYVQDVIYEKFTTTKANKKRIYPPRGGGPSSAFRLPGRKPGLNCLSSLCADGRNDLQKTTARDKSFVFKAPWSQDAGAVNLKFAG
jgi:hypothetical protein